MQKYCKVILKLLGEIKKSVSKKISTGALKGVCDVDTHRWKIVYPVSLNEKFMSKFRTFFRKFSNKIPARNNWMTNCRFI